ncbi:hypothetical protein [Flavobacterium piscis]|uniref:Uncharacterized protein n=1 Tax=Flavobacterium piscis TaxID=1114874 RepID=A0ABU1Y8F4_9FLAO|nr:hypothetical protein [Flavobacterium piscis]MDR7210517.1 hypothetical protein [Flavobacterium piscis]
MGKQKLQEKVDKKAFLESFIKLGIDFLKTMPEEEVNSRNKDLRKLNLTTNMIYDFSIDSENFIFEIYNSYENKPTEIKRKLDYFKIYFIQDDNDLFSICFSLSSEETEKYEDNDSFFKINCKNEIEKMEKDEFIKYSKNYRDKLLQTINSQTMIDGVEIKNTEAISYKLKDLYFFILKHFLIKPISDYSKLSFQMIKFEENVEEQNNRNKLSLVVRAEDDTKGKGDAYNFGTVYP